MKFYLLPLLMLVCTCSVAQQPALTDDLSIPMDSVVSKYKLSYDLDPVHYNERLNQIRKEAYRRIKLSNANATTLKRLAVDYYLRNLLPTYRTFFQWGKKRDTLTAAHEKYIDSLIYANGDLNNEALYKGSAAYREWIDKYLDHMYQTKYKSDTVITWAKGAMLPMSVVVQEIQNPFIMDYECYRHASLYLKVVENDSALAGKIYRDFNAAVTNPNYRGDMQQVYDNYRRLHIAGAPAPDFNYPTVDGKQLTLSSLHGKLVYIDLWATWCGPCKMQIPFLMKLEEQYKGKNIAFISLSVDKQADAREWRNYVTGNKLTGYQVMADSDFKSDFIKKFNVALIPRFLLIDPAGKVVDGEAKMPSDPALKKQIDQLLGIAAAPFALSSYARKTDFSGHWQLNKSRTNFGKVPERVLPNTMNVTKDEAALVVDRGMVNDSLQEKHYLEQFRLDGASTQTTTNSGSLEVDSMVNNPDISALTLGMLTKRVTLNLNVTEAWTLEDGGKTLVVDRKWTLPGLGAAAGVKGYYDKK